MQANALQADTTVFAFFGALSPDPVDLYTAFNRPGLIGDFNGRATLRLLS